MANIDTKMANTDTKLENMNTKQENNVEAKFEAMNNEVRGMKMSLNEVKDGFDHLKEAVLEKIESKERKQEEITSNKSLGCLAFLSMRDGSSENSLLCLLNGDLQHGFRSRPEVC
jgi:hypothetical protein